MYVIFEHTFVLNINVLRKHQFCLDLLTTIIYVAVWSWAIRMTTISGHNTPTGCSRSMYWITCRFINLKWAALLDLKGHRIKTKTNDMLRPGPRFRKLDIQGMPERWVSDSEIRLLSVQLPWRLMLYTQPGANLLHSRLHQVCSEITPPTAAVATSFHCLIGLDNWSCPKLWYSKRFSSFLVFYHNKST